MRLFVPTRTKVSWRSIIVSCHSSGHGKAAGLDFCQQYGKQGPAGLLEWAGLGATKTQEAKAEEKITKD